MSGDKHTSLRTRIARGRGKVRTLAAPLAAVVVVLGIVAVLFVSGAAGPGLGAAIQPTPPPAGATGTSYAQEKATIVARDSATLTAMPPSTQPTPTYPTGIFQTHQSPVGNSIFSVMTEYEGPLGSQWVFVYAGTAWTDFPNTGNGALMVYITNKGHSTFDAPDGSSWLNITAINGTVLQLQSDKSKSLTFDLATDTFGG
ncbi:MAG TPA: hypothetical protein VKT52_07725 [Ktedonobacterales bacterium]|nr:hypothetical protein [Ktedonobacterales bacterium]